MDAFGKVMSEWVMPDESVSQSVFYQVLNPISEKKMFKGEIIFHLKRILKRLLLQLKGLIQIIVKFKAEKNFAHISIIHQTSFWRVQNIVHQNNCVAKLERIENLYFPKEK